MSVFCLNVLNNVLCCSMRKVISEISSESVRSCLFLCIFSRSISKYDLLSDESRQQFDWFIYFAFCSVVCLQNLVVKCCVCCSVCVGGYFVAPLGQFQLLLCFLPSLPSCSWCMSIFVGEV